VSIHYINYGIFTLYEKSSADFSVFIPYYKYVKVKGDIKTVCTAAILLGGRHIIMCEHLPRVVT